MPSAGRELNRGDAFRPRPNLPGESIDNVALAWALTCVKPGTEIRYNHAGGILSYRSAHMSIRWPKRGSPSAAAWDDLVEGMSKSWMWSSMAMQDIRMRYRGSLLGPFWLTISMVIMIAAMGVIYARLFNMEITRYLPFLTVGLVIWSFVSTVIIEGCQTFLSAQNVITQVRMPFSVHAWRTVCRNLIVLAHNMVIVPLVLIIFHVSVGWSVIFIVPALVVLTINGLWISILLGMISARYRDVPPIVMSFVQVIFFITRSLAAGGTRDLDAGTAAQSPVRRGRRRSCSSPRQRPLDLFVAGAVDCYSRRVRVHVRAVRKISVAYYLLDLSMAFLRLHNLSVEFPVYQGGSQSLKKMLVAATTQGNLARDAMDRINVRALNDVTLNIEDGDRLGLIGANGAGKTTLLRVLAGIYAPTRGEFDSSGKVSALLDVSVGLNPEATGRENIILRGMYMNIHPREMRLRVDDIAVFTELGPYLHMPTRTYSSGMMIRLGFAVSTCVPPADPGDGRMALWPGTPAFWTRRRGGWRHSSRQFQHSRARVAFDGIVRGKWCNRGILLQHGRIVGTGRHQRSY